MSSTAAPFGMRPVYHGSGLIRPVRREILNNSGTGYATQILSGQPVVSGTDGTIQAVTATTDRVLGVFLGCEFIDSTGRPVKQNWWPASQALQSGSKAYAYVLEDPMIVYEMQANGAVALTDIGSQMNVITTTAFSVTGGSTSTGLSAAGLDIATKTTSSTAQFRIVNLAPYVDNEWGDTYTVVQVQISKHSFRADVNAF